MQKKVVLLQPELPQVDISVRWMEERMDGLLDGETKGQRDRELAAWLAG